MFGLGDKTDDEIDAARGKKIAKYQKQSGAYQRKEAGYAKKAQNYRNGRGHGIGSLNVKTSSEDVSAAKQRMLDAKASAERAHDDMEKAKRDLVAKRVMDPKKNTLVLFNQKSNGWENVNGKNYQVKKSGKVTERQLQRSVRRVYGESSPRASDRGVAARTVYPPHPTARQLNNWERNPGRVDIRGIDAPDSSIVTARRTVTIPKGVKNQIGMRSYSVKPSELPRMYYKATGKTARIGDIVRLDDGDYAIESVERLPIPPGKSGIIGIRNIRTGFYREVYANSVLGIAFEGYEWL